MAERETIRYDCRRRSRLSGTTLSSCCDMAIFRATEMGEQRLIALPESGMGFQVVRYRGNVFVALNATILVPLAELREGRATADEIAALLAEGRAQLDVVTERIELADDVWLAFSQLDPEYRDPQTGLNSPEIVAAPPESVISPKRPYSYYRFSVAPRDKRVAFNGDFLPGTYATTFADFHFVPSGFAAVGRYALPSPASARFVFQIVTFDRPSKMGTATPNFGQAGGGVEVLFANGAKNGAGLSYMIDAG